MLGGEMTTEFFIAKNVGASVLIQLERGFRISPSACRRISIGLNLDTKESQL